MAKKFMDQNTESFDKKSNDKKKTAPENTSSLKAMITDSLDKVRTIIDADTIIGKQIQTPSGTVIIPISKVSMGFASGGLDLPSDDKKTTKNFGGGGGTGVSVTPVGFLTVYPDGKVEMLNMYQEKVGPIEQIAEIIDNTPDVINRIKNVFFKDSEIEVEDIEIVSEESILVDAANDADKKLSKKEKKELKKQNKQNDKTTWNF